MLDTGIRARKRETSPVDRSVGDHWRGQSSAAQSTHKGSHYLDIALIQNRQFKCGEYNANERIEKEAEVFALNSFIPSQNS
jgi:hypothetical protein